jgi:hypothetical protein
LGEEETINAVDDDAYIKEIKDISTEVDFAMEKLQREH